MVSEWILEYEVRSGQLNELRTQLDFINEFLAKKTKNTF
jgi:hypothetical protein